MEKEEKSYKEMRKRRRQAYAERSIDDKFRFLSKPIKEVAKCLEVHDVKAEGVTSLCELCHFI